MSDKNVKPTVIALGYFDSVHTGHQKVINSAREYANENGCSLTVFTFKGNLKAMLTGTDDKCVFLPKEREEILKNLGADEIFFAPVDFKFLSLSRRSFLRKLNKKYNIKCYVCGSDYKFGKHGKGNVEYLQKWAKKKKQAQITVEDHIVDGQKVSTTYIKELLTNGEIKKANVLLGRPYSVTGTVFKDRTVGSDLGFPTLNIRIDNEKHRLKEGVYAGKFDYEGKEYRAIINYGGRPTFDLNTSLIEAHVIDFCGDLYGKSVTLQFLTYIREVKKFSGIEQLTAQLSLDMSGVKEGKYD